MGILVIHDVTTFRRRISIDSNESDIIMSEQWVEPHWLILLYTPTYMISIFGHLPETTTSVVNIPVWKHFVKYKLATHCPLPTHRSYTLLVSVITDLHRLSICPSVQLATKKSTLVCKLYNLYTNFEHLIGIRLKYWSISDNKLCLEG